MRSLLLILSIILSCAQSFAQVQNDSIPEVEGEAVTVYAELLGINANVLGLGKKTKVEVDFGDESWGWRGNDGRDLLVDENGKVIKFNSMVDAMNYMGKRGWKFESSYVVTVANQNVIHWLMSKQIHDGENAKKGIKQRRDIKKKKERTNESGSKNFDDDIYQ